jgi:hypothetical protein
MALVSTRITRMPAVATAAEKTMKRAVAGSIGGYGSTARSLLLLALPLLVTSCTPTLTEEQAHERLSNDSAMAMQLAMTSLPLCSVTGEADRSGEVRVRAECVNDVAAAGLNRGKPQCLGRICTVVGNCGTAQLKITSIKQNGKTATVDYAVTSSPPAVSEKCVKVTPKQPESGTKTLDYVDGKWL